ncbi:MAG: chromosomal replication initiator protein DnaA [Candidatus Magasanikbacteria bacterium GW2011_GWC2_40_17]|uniref:Chromosomal replication initiator protein DnaA n=1 Tax=Candidatus Magasanikbacteria bacterium GW2011_GWA2_42_32 TaxID=1619039 RepID=A0A0G1CEG6_9BACT|nr:MAG: chromosomal replication initiator protein DnaA [Candidatus Magasanikbacteria bacterium GW2011_GWC2_40_17]KKS57076.1 MAG: chromosomal replication initiator protein DnaA [Candidatus Magasanikbacteria bacterium GW2011_GWA2_42_32]
MSPQQIWEAVLAELELSVSRANFVTWFKNTFLGSFENEEAIICVPSHFYKTYLEKRFHPTLVKLIEKISGLPLRSLTYKIEIKKTITTQPAPFLAPQETAKISQISVKMESAGDSANVFGLNPRHTFPSFVVGKGNELAHAAAQAVANQPGKAYNPLFIYGGSGLGKTHLVQAIGNQLLRESKVRKVVYVTSEKFTNEFIHSIRSGNAKAFQDTYRNADLLLIDDIQFISGKQETQEAFFHTFNTLHQLERQVVITSDRPPKAIPLLEDRLRSRFEMGMIADIASPDFETRMAILEQKCQEKGFGLEKKILSVIASLIQNNVRELEGALNKIHAYFQLKNDVPDEAGVRALIASLANTASQKVVTPKHILQTTAEFYDIRIEEILSSKRDKRLAFPRQIVMYLMREELKTSYPGIGTELGGRDHTTAMHACKKIEREIAANFKTKEEINQIRQRLYSV